MAQNDYPQLLKRILSGRPLSFEEAHEAFSRIMEGTWSESRIAGLLVALAAKGETVDEICGAAQAMREHVLRIDNGGAQLMDTCGTGGTGISTFNISTAASFVLAGAGVTVAKHGNRTHTRASGSANVLGALGVNIEATPETVATCLRQANVGFCFAVLCHPAMKYAVPVRKELGVRTMFNVLGPLTNPAGAQTQLMGVFDADLTDILASVLGRLGAQRAMVVHAEDGLDEISTTSPTKISELVNREVNTYKVQPEDFDLPRARMEDLLIDSPEASAAAIREVLSGQSGPRRDIVTLNAAAGLYLAGKAPSIRDGLGLARNSIDSGAAGKALDKLVAASQS
jgi:anthranilate phosphoribosyltransferase